MGATSRMSYLGPGAAVVACAAAAWLLVRPPHQAAQKHAPRRDRAHHAEAQEVEPSAPVPSPAAPLANVAPPARPSPPAEQPADVIEVPLQPTPADERDFYQVRFDEQQRDRTWSGDAESQLRSLFGRFETRASRLLSVSCRADTCRALISHDDEQAYQSYFQKVMTDHTWNGAGFVTPESPNTWNMIAFFFKPGFQPPQL